MNEHSIREIARVASEAHNEFAVVALGHDRIEWDEMHDEDMDEKIELTRTIIDTLSTGQDYVNSDPTRKVFVRVVKALANSERLL